MTDIEYAEGIMCAFPDRDEAVAELAQKINSNGWWILVPHPNLISDAIKRLSSVGESVYYGDNGTNTTIVLTGDRAYEFLKTPAAIATSLKSSAFLITVPKSVPAATLSRIFGDEFPSDGSRDIALLGDGKELGWPVILLDAFEIVSPGSTEAIREQAY